MGGSIRVDSELGKGALFQVELPVELVDLNDIPKSVIQHGDILALAPGQPHYRILIVEDQHENRLLLSRLMMDIGLPVKLAENGEQCLQLFPEWQPDLIWMDKLMPVMDGLEATKRLRRLPNGQAVKIVAVTASVFKEQQQEMLDAGMDDVVRKPYRFNEIYECLARQLNLEYLYRSEAQTGTNLPQTLTADKLEALPAALRQQLREALTSLDSDQIAIAISQIKEIDPTLGFSLARLADYFDYPAIIKALDNNETL